jgi:cohesin loading factor subunit SCC2
MSSTTADAIVPFDFQAEDQANTSYLLKIFSTCVTRMPKTATNFARTLEGKLLPMVNKASGGAMVCMLTSSDIIMNRTDSPSRACCQGLQESIACLCAVVNNLTRSYERLVKLLASCVSQ